MPYFYHAEIRVDGILWHHTRAQPSADFYVSQPHFIFHNYGFTLALARYITDPDVGYVSLFGKTRYKKPLELLRRYGVYAYPLLVTKALLKEMLMSASNEGVIMIRGKSRLAYPLLTRNVILMPGTELRTLVVSKDKLPDQLAVEIGAKRNGVLRMKLFPVTPREEASIQVIHPFNLADTVDVVGYTVVMSHGAGDIGVFGTAAKGYVYRINVREREIHLSVPALQGVE